MYTQSNPKVLEGNLLPDAQSMPQVGVFFRLTTTGVLYLLSNLSGVKTWVAISSSEIVGSIDVEFWVDSVNGNDANNGSQAHPFRTLPFAYALTPATPSGKCRIHLIGVGPYTLPEFINGVEPQGPNGQSLIICGDTMTQVRAGTVQSVSGATLTPTVGGMTVDAYRGMVYHGLTGTSAGKYFTIATNSATQLTSIGNTFDAAINDTFEILKPRTVVASVGDVIISGPGKIGFWRCKMTGNHTDIVDDASVLWDACEMAQDHWYTTRLRGRSYFIGIHEAYGFLQITDIGTQSGIVAPYFSNITIVFNNGVRAFDGGLNYGYIVSNRGLNTLGGGSWRLFGLDVDMSLIPGIDSLGFVITQQSYLEINPGWNRIVGSSGASSIGITVSENSYADLRGVVITVAALAAVIVQEDSAAALSGISGSSGNGIGIWVLSGGVLLNNPSGIPGPNTVSGTAGDIVVGASSAPISWAQAGLHIGSEIVDFVEINTRKTFASHPAVTRTTPEYIPIDTAGGSFTVNLPAANAVPPGWRREFKDETGNCTANIFILAAVGGDTIPEGTANTARITTNYGKFTIQSNGVSAWYLV